MTVQERDDAATQLDRRGLDRLPQPELAFALDEGAGTCTIHTPDASERETTTHWLTSDAFADLEAMR
jgi:hypothetical protein